MSFSDKLNTIIADSLKVSQDFIKKAGEKTKEWGEKGVLQFEILQLRGQAERLTASLGAAVYALLVEQGAAAVTRDAPSIKPLLDKLADLEMRISENEKKFSAMGGKDEDLRSGT